MKRAVTFFVVIALLGAIHPAAALAGKSRWRAVKGSGNLVADTRDVSTFVGIEANSKFDVEITVGSGPSVVVYVDDNLQSLVTTKVEDGWLVIEDEEDWKSDEHVRIEITTPTLEGFELNGAGDIEITGVTGDLLKVDVNGSGDIDLEGQITEIKIEVNGVGDVDARELYAEIASVKVNGAGDVHVRASERLRGRVSGMGDVFSYGKPEHSSVNVSGMGSLVER